MFPFYDFYPIYLSILSVYHKNSIRIKSIYKQEQAIILGRTESDSPRNAIFTIKSKKSIL